MQDQRFPVFDGHNDTLTHLYLPERGKNRSFFEESEIGHLDLPRARKGGFCGGIFAIFTPPPEDSPEANPYYGFECTENGYRVKPRSPIDQDYAEHFTDSVIDLAYKIEEESRGQVQIVGNYQELKNCLENGIISIVLHLEGAAAVREDLHNLEDYYRKGIRSLGPVWSRPNIFGKGVPFRFPHSPDTGPGLTEAGKELIRECNRVGIMIDLAHINEKGFWDVANISRAPLVVSHTDVHSICPSTRNLTDKQIDAVAASGGIIGINFESTNMNPDGVPGVDMPLTQIVKHIDHIVDRTGIEYVAFGSDFDGARMPKELKDVTGLPRLIQALKSRGYDHNSIHQISYKNWFRVLKATMI